MKRFVAPYGIRFQEDGCIDVFPAIEVLVQGKKTGIRALFHIDSGATTSVLPIGDAEVLGVSLGSAKRVVIRGIAQNILIGMRSTISIELVGGTMRVPVIFAAGEHIPRILGREGIFRRFGILFDESRRRTLFFNAQKKQRTINRLFAKQQ